MGCGESYTDHSTTHSQVSDPRSYCCFQLEIISDAEERMSLESIDSGFGKQKQKVQMSITKTQNKTLTPDFSASTVASFLTFFSSQSKSLQVDLLAFHKLLKTIRVALSAYPSKVSDFSALDHPLLITIPVGSGRHSVVLSLLWLDYLVLLPALKLHSASGVSIIDQGFSSRVLQPSGIRGQEGGV